MNDRATSVQLSPSEVRAIMDNPHGLCLLMDYADLQHSQAASMLEPGEVEQWPSKRWQYLRERGRKIIDEDPELWGDDIKCAFGLEGHNAKLNAGQRREEE